MKRLFVLALLLALAACSAPAQQVQIREVQVVVTATPEPNADVESYATWAIGWTERLAMNSERSASAANGYDLDGMARHAREAITLCEEPTQQSPPPQLSETHRYLLLACEEYTTASKLVIRGVGNLDLDALEAAVLHLDLGTGYMDMATNAIPQ